MKGKPLIDLAMTGYDELYLYRVWKDNISEAQKDNLRLKLYRGEFSRADVTRCTKRLGDEIGKVYGWTFPERKERSYER